ncbi:MAG: dihydrofolate reductase family protein [Patescibacteria group bacterium]
MIKCFIIAAMTADGYIAKEVKHAAFWTSKEDKKRFIELTKRAGVVIMGLNTFQTLPRPLNERRNIVYSPEKIEGIETTAKEPKELFKELENQGVKEVAICGGSQIYTMFMKAGVVDRLYLTIEPLVFGNGLRLFKEELHYHLELKSAVQAESGALLLEYKVDYSGKPKLN